jgi:hypothetical protein
MHNYLRVFTLTRQIRVKHYFIPFFFTAAVLRWLPVYRLRPFDS